MRPRAASAAGATNLLENQYLVSIEKIIQRELAEKRRRDAINSTNNYAAWKIIGEALGEGAPSRAAIDAAITGVLASKFDVYWCACLGSISDKAAIIAM